MGLLVPALFLTIGVALLALALFAPPDPADRVRALEAAGRTGRRALLLEALDDPDPNVAAVAAIVLRESAP